MPLSTAAAQRMMGTASRAPVPSPKPHPQINEGMQPEVVQGDQGPWLHRTVPPKHVLDGHRRNRLSEQRCRVGVHAVEDDRNARRGPGQDHPSHRDCLLTPTGGLSPAAAARQPCRGPPR